MKCCKSNIQNDWTQNITNYEEKLALAKRVAGYAQNGDVIGFGSGSTALLAVREIGKRIKAEKLDIIAVPTSKEIEVECNNLNIKTAGIGEIGINWGFDGADEVDANQWLLKGRGGALLKEKQVMKASPKTYILVDKSKFVKKLGDNYPVPIECKIESLQGVKEGLKKLNAKEIDLRLASADTNAPYITENGNYILDCVFNTIEENMEKDINKIDGVVDNGLFIGYNVEIL